MATKAGERKLSEAELNAPDLDDDGNLDVEHYPIPDGSGIKDEYLRSIWDEAVKGLNQDQEKPVREQADPQEKVIYAVSYRGESMPPAVARLGPERDVRKFFAWLRTQTPELQQVAIDSSTNPAGGREDVERFSAELYAALKRVDGTEGLGPMIRGMGGLLVNLAQEGQVEGIVVSDQLPEELREQ